MDRGHQREQEVVRGTISYQSRYYSSVLTTSPTSGNLESSRRATLQPLWDDAANIGLSGGHYVFDVLMESDGRGSDGGWAW